jgi:hypothetical protein
MADMISSYRRKCRARSDHRGLRIDLEWHRGVVLVLGSLSKASANFRVQPEEALETLVARVDVARAGLGLIRLRAIMSDSALLFEHGHQRFEGLGPQQLLTEAAESEDVSSFICCAGTSSSW